MLSRFSESPAELGPIVRCKTAKLCCSVSKNLHFPKSSIMKAVRRKQNVSPWEIKFAPSLDSGFAIILFWCSVLPGEINCSVLQGEINSLMTAVSTSFVAKYGYKYVHDSRFATGIVSSGVFVGPRGRSAASQSL